MDSSEGYIRDFNIIRKIGNFFIEFAKVGIWACFHVSKKFGDCGVGGEVLEPMRINLSKTGLWVGLGREESDRPCQMKLEHRVRGDLMCLILWISLSEFLTKRALLLSEFIYRTDRAFHSMDFGRSIKTGEGGRTRNEDRLEGGNDAFTIIYNLPHFCNVGEIEVHVPEDLAAFKKALHSSIQDDDLAGLFCLLCSSTV